MTQPTCKRTITEKTALALLEQVRAYRVSAKIVHGAKDTRYIDALIEQVEAELESQPTGYPKLTTATNHQPD